MDRVQTNLSQWSGATLPLQVQLDLIQRTLFQPFVLSALSSTFLQKILRVLLSKLVTSKSIDENVL